VFQQPLSIAILQNNVLKPQLCSDVRYDGVGHWPECQKVRAMCRLVGCKGVSRVVCRKCCVSLYHNPKKCTDQTLPVNSVNVTARPLGRLTNAHRYSGIARLDRAIKLLHFIKEMPYKCYKLKYYILRSRITSSIQNNCRKPPINISVQYRVNGTSAQYRLFSAINGRMLE